MNFAIIGHGKMGRLREKVIIEANLGHVIHVCDVENPDRMADFTKDFRDIFNDPSVDAVIIATPNYLIKDLVVKTLDSGKHVFAEKPPGISVSEVKEMIAAEERNPGLKLKFGFNHRCHDSIMMAKKQIDSGEFGKILWMRSRYGKSVDESFKNNWRSDKKKAGNGILMDQGIHMLDLLMMLSGGFDGVKSYCSNLYWNLDIEDNVFALLKNKSTGVVASLHSTMTQWRHLFSLEIFLERGYMVVNGLLTSSGTYTNGDGKEILTISKKRSKPPLATHPEEERFSFSVDNSWKIEIEDFIEDIKNNTPVNSGNTKDALELMTLVEMIYENGMN